MEAASGGKGERHRGWKRGEGGGGGVGTRTGQTRVPTARVRDKRVTSGPFTQNAFVRPDILISMPTRGNGTEETLQEEDRYTPTLGQVTESCAV